MTLRTFADEAHACRWWLGSRDKSKGSLLDHIPGRSTSPVDVDATLRAIDRAICTLPLEWRGVTVVNAGWRRGVDALKDPAPDDGGPPHLERAELPWTWRGWPAGLAEASLRLRRQQLLAALVTVGVVERHGHVDAAPVLVVQRSEEDRVEKPLHGWKVIADALGVSEDTAQLWADEEGLPVVRGKRRRVFALPSQLQDWMERRVVASLAAQGVERG